MQIIPFIDVTCILTKSKKTKYIYCQCVHVNYVSSHASKIYLHIYKVHLGTKLYEKIRKMSVQDETSKVHLGLWYSIHRKKELWKIFQRIKWRHLFLQFVQKKYKLRKKRAKAQWLHNRLNSKSKLTFYQNKFA